LRSFALCVQVARYFGGDPASWLVLQASYDLKNFPTQAEIEQRVKAREPMAA